MDNEERYLENKAVQVGAGTLVISGMSAAGLSTAGCGAVAVGKVAGVLASLGPVGWIAGGALLIGGIVHTAVTKEKK